MSGLRLSVFKGITKVMLLVSGRAQIYGLKPVLLTSVLPGGESGS